MSLYSILALTPGSALLPEAVGLAAVATIAYLLGMRKSRVRRLPRTETPRGEGSLTRARRVALELDETLAVLRTDVDTHQKRLNRFHRELAALGEVEEGVVPPELTEHVEQILPSTLQLVMKTAVACEELRQQSQHLTTVSEARTDALTGVGNVRALEETITNMLTVLPRQERPFSIGIFDIDHFRQINNHQGRSEGDRMLQKFARLLDDAVRKTDVVGRYGGEEFVVIMPHTPLGGAKIFAERLRSMVEERLPLTISGGLAEARNADSPQGLLARADAALYSAKAGGRNCVFQHNGRQIDPSQPRPATPAAEASPAAATPSPEVAASPAVEAATASTAE